MKVYAVLVERYWQGKTEVLDHLFRRRVMQGTYLLTYLITYLLTYLIIYLLTYLPTYLLTYKLTYLLTYLPTYLLTYLLINLLTYLLTNSMVQSLSWEANWFAASQEILSITRNPKVHYHRVLSAWNTTQQYASRLRLKRDGTRAETRIFVFRRNGRVHLNQWGASVQSTTGRRGVRHQR